MKLASQIEPYPVEILDPDTGDLHEVKLRRLSAGAYAEAMDLLFAGDEGVEGRYRLLMVQKTVVSWDIPELPPPSDAIITELPPEVVLQIFSQIDRRDRDPFIAAAAARARQSETRQDSPAAPGPTESPADASAVPAVAA